MNRIKIRKGRMITMNESYKELMVKRERGIKEMVMLIVCIVPTVLLALLAFTGSPVIFIAAVACGVLPVDGY